MSLSEGDESGSGDEEGDGNDTWLKTSIHSVQVDDTDGESFLH